MMTARVAGLAATILLCTLFSYGSSDAAANAKNSSAKDRGFSRYVDPFIGLDGNGNVFPGPTLPFGVVKLGPDTDQNGNAGYTSSGRILGFSHLHVSGTGGGPKYGVVLVMPTTGPLESSEYGSDRADESASVGYYSVELVRYNVKAELTASRRVGFHRYAFNNAGESHILIDIGHFLSSSFKPESQRFLEARSCSRPVTKSKGMAVFKDDDQIRQWPRVRNRGQSSRYGTPKQVRAIWNAERTPIASGVVSTC